MLTIERNPQGDAELPTHLRAENGASTCDDPEHIHYSVRSARECVYAREHPSPFMQRLRSQQLKPKDLT